MLNIEKISKRVKVREEIFSPFKSRYIMEPLYGGYGHTVGNMLRRVLLSSIPGTAIKAVKIDGIVGEFSTLKGVKENIVDILLNLKGVVIKANEFGEKKATISIKGPKVVKASDIKAGSSLTVVNRDHVIANVTENVEFKLDLLIDTGEGFTSSGDVDQKDWPVGFLAVDSIYSPIVNMSYKVDDTMVGRVTNYDKLTIELETNGSIETREAMSYAVELVNMHVNAFLDIGNRMEHLREPIEDIEEDEAESRGSTLPDIKLEDLDLSVRSYNCLKKIGIINLHLLSKMTAKDLLGVKNLGKSSLNEIIAKLKEYNVDIEIEIPRREV